MRPARVEFVKGETTRYRSLLHRPDGVTVEFDGGSYNKVPGAIPHDLAHLIVEDELGLTCGVWGVLVAGGLFRHAKVVAGRQAPHAAERGREIVDAAREQIMQAEMLTRAVCEGAPPPGVSADAVDRCRRRLLAGAKAWAALPSGGTLPAEWPHAADPALTATRGVKKR